MHTPRTSIAALFAIVSVGSTVTFAQLSASQQETIDIPIGSIFEIAAAVDPGFQANWVLTNNGTLVEASRDIVFRTRFSKEGNYTLAAEAGTSQRIFQLIVRQRRPEDAVVPTNPADAIAFDPKMEGDSITISQSMQIVRFTPMRDDAQVLALDFDITVDSNGDGNPANDEDTRNTLFRSEGNPLHVWFVDGKERTIRTGVLLENGTPQFQNIRIGESMIANQQQQSSQISTPQASQTSESSQASSAQTTQTSSSPTSQASQASISTVPEEPIEQSSSLKVLVVKSDNGEIQFAVRLPVEQGMPVILLWDFGDGTQSMLDSPIHTYAESGTYTISVDIRDLKTGRVIDSATDNIMVNKINDQSSSVRSDDGGSQKSSTKSSDNKSSGKKSGMLGLVIKLILSLVVSGAVGGLIMFIIGKVKSRGFSLEKSLERAEQVMVKTPEETVGEAAPPMEITAEDITDSSEEDEPEQESDQPPAPPPPAPAPAPTPAPAPASAPAPVPPAPAPAPAEHASRRDASTDSPPQQPAARDSTTPSWLSAGLEKAEQQEVVPVPPVQSPEPPTPEPPPPPPPTTQPSAQPASEQSPPPLQSEPPAPSVTHTPMEPTAKQLETNASNAPDWLQAGIQKAESIGQTPTSPPPPAIDTPAPPTEVQQTPAVDSFSASGLDPEKEEALREKKRKKRQRYRENVKQRKDDGTEEALDADAFDEEPIAFVTAEDVPLRAAPPPMQSAASPPPSNSESTGMGTQAEEIPPQQPQTDADSGTV